MSHAFVVGPPGTGNPRCHHLTPCGREGVEGDVHEEVDWRALVVRVAWTGMRLCTCAVDGPCHETATCLRMCVLAAIADIDAALLSAGKSGGE